MICMTKEEDQLRELESDRQWALHCLSLLRNARESRDLRPRARGAIDVSDRLFGEPDFMALLQAEGAIRHYLKARRRLAIAQDDEARSLKEIKRELTEELKFLGPFLEEKIERHLQSDAENEKN